MRSGEVGVLLRSLLSFDSLQTGAGVRINRPQPPRLFSSENHRQKTSSTSPDVFVRKHLTKTSGEIGGLLRSLFVLPHVGSLDEVPLYSPRSCHTCSHKTARKNEVWILGSIQFKQKYSQSEPIRPAAGQPIRP